MAERVDEIEEAPVETIEETIEFLEETETEE